MYDRTSGVGRHTRRIGLALVAAAGIALAGAVAEPAFAQAGCTHTLSIYCGGRAYCTTDPGSNCISCPKPQ